MTNLLRRKRERTGLTQAELAERAGVSRQLVGTVESGRHQPRVDAALALAAALDISVEALFPQPRRALDALTGMPPGDGELVRFGRVGEQVVTAATRVGSDGWDVADGVIENGELVAFGHDPPSFVVAGCEPGLEVLERLLREQGIGAVSVTASSVVALEALRHGRVHAAVVHGPKGCLPPQPKETPVTRFQLTQWDVGLCGPPGVSTGLWRDALAGRSRVVQREPGAQAQNTFARALTSPGATVAGPRVGSHVEAARAAIWGGLAGVTIEPAALAVGAEFHQLATHEAQLWIDTRWLDARPATEALNLLASARFQRILSAVGGYELASCGSNAS